MATKNRRRRIPSSRREEWRREREWELCWEQAAARLQGVATNTYAADARALALELFVARSLRPWEVKHG